jgi:methyl-accepting chemotaxis protein
MNKALIRLEAVTEHNAGLVKQANASALQLSHDSDQLADLVGRFRLDDAGTAPRAGAGSRDTGLRVATSPAPKRLRIASKA